jgi:hypothetical protein
MASRYTVDLVTIQSPLIYMKQKNQLFSVTLHLQYWLKLIALHWLEANMDS